MPKKKPRNTLKGLHEKIQANTDAYAKKFTLYALQMTQEQGKQLPQYCILCGGEPAALGVFFPKHPEFWGGKKDTPRAIMYALCERCLERSNKAEAVERKITALDRSN